jgi:hypothetical protein
MAAAVASAFGDLSHHQHQQQQAQQAGMMQAGSSGLAAGWGRLAGTPLAAAGHGGSSNAASPWPRQFMCPLTGQVMGDPVMAADGHTYERAAISDWLRLRDLSPVTGQPLSSAVLQPNYSLRQAIGGELAKLQGAGLM